MTGDLFQVLLLSVDSLFAGLLLGPMVKTWRKHAVLACLFGLCDGAAVLLGAALPRVMLEVPDGLLYALIVSAVVLAARQSKSWLLLAPVILSLDNLASGLPADAAPELAAASAAMAIGGLMLSATCVRAGEALHRIMLSGRETVAAR